MRLLINIPALALLAATMSSCGIFGDMDSTDFATAMDLNRHDISLMVGDTFQLEVTYAPETAKAPDTYWEVMQGMTITSVDPQGVVTATQVGESLIRARATANSLTDTCHVSTFARWEWADIPNNEYDMVVYADVQAHGLSNNGIQVAAFINNQLRGLGEVSTSQDRTYTRIRVWHSYPQGGTVTFRYYIPAQARAGLLDYSTTFSGETQGSLSNLIPMQPQ
ncbi:MAG: hypothetical protein LIP02_03785 [Bacteroidales bacterium]|nr:hypothetical protein [Bacteroidales bacterium]